MRVIAATLAFTMAVALAFAQERPKKPPERFRSSKEREKRPQEKSKKPRINWLDARRLDEYLEKYPEKKYLLIHALNYKQRIEIPPAPQLVAASNGEWMFLYLLTDKDSALKRSMGLGETPVFLGCDRNLSEFMRSEDRSVPSLMKILHKLPVEIVGYEARVKRDYERMIATLSQDDPKEAVRTLVEFILKNKGDTPEVRDAVEKLEGYAEEDFRKAELALTLSVEKGVEYLRGMVERYKTTPPGAKAEFQIAELKLEEGDTVAAVRSLRKVYANRSPYVEEERREAGRLLYEIKEESPEALVEADKPVVAPKPVIVKVDVPPLEARKESEKLVRDIFKDDYARARRTSEERQKLAVKLLEQGRKTEDDPAAKYVLFDQARDLAVQAGDARLAFEAVEEIVSRFKVDGLKLRADTLERVSGLARTPEAARAVAEAYVELIEAAIVEDDYTAANSALSKANSAARRARDVTMLAHLKDLSTRVSDLRREYYRVRSDHAKLKANPDDPAANLSYGLFVCLIKGDWEKGLPLLAKGSDAAIKELAGMDLAGPSEPADQVKVADGWWGRSEKERNDTRKQHLIARAQHWYELALEKLTGLSKLKVENRLEEIVKASASRYASRSIIDLLSWIHPTRDAVPGGGRWRISNRKLMSPPDTDETRYVRIMIPCVPPGEYDLGVKVERKAARGPFYIGLVAEGHQFIVMLEYDNAPLLSGIGSFGGASIYGRYLSKRYPTEKLDYTQAVFTPGRPINVVCSVRKKLLQVVVNGKVILEWKNPPYASGMTGERLTVPNKKCLFLGCQDLYPFEVTGVTLVPISGPPLRVSNSGSSPGVIAPIPRR